MKNIKRLRAINDISQEKLAKLVGVSRTTMNTWENNASELSEENEKKLLNIFQCNIYELYGMDEFKHYPKEKENKIGIILMLYHMLEPEERMKLIEELEDCLYE